LTAIGVPTKVSAMAKTPSTMRALGSPLPSFRLQDVVGGDSVDARDLEGQVTVVAFICNHCPFVVHLKPALVEFGKFCVEKGVRLVAISSNDAVAYPMDGSGEMAREARELGYEFPYLYDETQEVARAFDAACTPDFFVFDRQGRLAYRGQFDDSRPGNGQPITGKDLKDAVTALCEGRAPSAEQRPSIGCNIKWKG
jgi:thiol-disulfide isomerase/thioredoxin